MARTSLPLSFRIWDTSILESPMGTARPAIHASPFCTGARVMYILVQRPIEGAAVWSTTESCWLQIWKRVSTSVQCVLEPPMGTVVGTDMMNNHQHAHQHSGDRPCESRHETGS